MARTLPKYSTNEDILAREAGTIYEAGVLNRRNSVQSNLELAPGLAKSGTLQLIRPSALARPMHAKQPAGHAYQEYAEPSVISPAVQGQSRRRVALVTQINRVLQATLIIFCGLVLIGYGLDVAVSNHIAKLQEQTRRLNEQNSELSAELLKSISFEGIQENILGGKRLRVPEQVIIVSEVPAVKVQPFKPHEHHLPIMSGY